MWGNEIILNADLRQAARDAYSVVWEPSRKLTRDHQKALDAAVAAALLKLSMVEEAAADHASRAGCSCSGGLPGSRMCQSCAEGPGEAAKWLHKVALQLDPDIETRD
jgi:hypothetical protein